MMYCAMRSGQKGQAVHLLADMATTPLPDHMVISIATDNAFDLGILSSKVHVQWSLATGGTLEDRPRYYKTRCFETFPFPALEEGPLKQRIRDLGDGERLDAHRKRQQEQHPGLTLTGMYHVLEKLRGGEPLNAKEKLIPDQGLVTVLRQIHDELDAAVLETYGSSHLAVETQDGKTQDVRPEQAQEELLTRLVALNHQRTAEEKRGHIRWLRPDYQNPASAAPHSIQTTLQGTEPDPSSSKIKNHQSSIDNPSSSLPWPDRLPEQVAILRKLIADDDCPSCASLLGCPENGVDRELWKSSWCDKRDGLL